MNKKRLKKVIINPWAIINLLAVKGSLKWLPDKLYLKLRFRATMHYKLNLKKPQTFSEKIQWLKVYDRKPEYITMVDKYAAKDYVENIIGNQYIIPTIGKWDNFDDIEFEKLPNQFVLKCNHDSGGIVICKDKSKLDYQSAKSKLEQSLKNNYYWWGREWAYKDVKPLIVCEEYIEPQQGSLLDYKLMCFNGKVKCSFVCLNRNNDTGLNVDFYDADWKRMDFERKYPSSKVLTPKPKGYEIMVMLSEKITENIPFARIDFYEVDGKIYFGEITLYPGNGMEIFYPKSADYLLGEWIELP